MSLQHNIRAVIKHGEDGLYIAEYLNLFVVTQGSTIDETASNLREAVELFLKDEDPKEYGFANNPRLMISLDVSANLH